MRIAIVLVAVGLAGAAVFRGAASATLDAGTKEAATLDSGSTVAVRSGFGTICGWNTGQSCEHERVTERALSCESPGPTRVRNCFEATSMSQLAGKFGQWGAVGTPDK